MDIGTIRKFRNALVLFLMLGMFGIGLLAQLFLPNSTQTAPAAPSAADFSRYYERTEVWDVRGDDTVQFATLDRYADASVKRSKWFSVPFMWSDADMAESTPLNCSVLEQRVEDSAYGGQTYRWHTYFVESDQREFGYQATFNVLPHVHITGPASRLLSIGVDPSKSAGFQTKSVIIVVLPDGVQHVTLTDLQPFKTLMYDARAMYYYDVRDIMAHQSIHIAYALTGAPTTNIGLSTIIDYDNPQ